MQKLYQCKSKQNILKNLCYLSLLLLLLTTSVNAQSVLELSRDIETRKELKAAGDDDVNDEQLATRLNVLSGLSELKLVPIAKANFSKIVDNSDDASKPLGAKHTVSLFFSQLTKDTLRGEYSLNFLIPEASTFGLMYEANAKRGKAGNNPLQRLNPKYSEVPFYWGWNVQAGLLGKTLPKTDSLGEITETNTTTTIFHARAGLEPILLQNTLSVYFNLNCIVPVNHNENFQSLYKTNKEQLFFWDIGARAILLSTEDSKSQITADFNLILRKPLDARVIIPTKDLFLPNVRIGYVVKVN